jgi:hypothetical protein
MNGKGDKPRKKNVDESTWEKNWVSIFGNKKSSQGGVKVEIDLGDGKKEEGYILRRLNIDNYEVWCEEQKKSMFLCREEFKEVDQ